MHPDDPFQPEKIIAAGPSAKVYRGVETMTGRKVLIKALLPDHETAHPLDRERLQQLAPALMQMRHPQIAGLIALLPEEEEFAIVSEFMPGISARTFAAERQPTPHDLRALAMQLMHALMVGEHLRQPHGDPKPSNLIIADHPGGGLFLQVQDWGLSLARQVHPQETLWFRAPELHAGHPPTTQSDLFTAAGSLFCLATNSSPTQATEVEEILRDWHTFNAGMMLHHLRPDIDPPLRDWLGWLLNPMPHMRPQAVAQALDMLMLSMHAGYAYMPQHAPVMAPGSQTTPLVAAMPPGAYTAPLVAAMAPPVVQATPVMAVPAPGVHTAPLVAAVVPGPQTPARPAAPQSTARLGRPAVANAVPAVPVAAVAAVPVAVAVAVSSTATPVAKAIPAQAPKKPFNSRVAVAIALNLVAVVVIGFFAWYSLRPPVSEQPAAAATASATKTTSPAKPIAAADQAPAKEPAPATTAPAAPAAAPVTATAGSSQ
ncbi:serine/threonine protein kinase [Prosthecobacter sp.]|uniref:serine/threonine protein kinase n=1 Tax=Prosthecobacter sp. TaxID=1965333 RepID=UPI003783166D